MSVDRNETSCTAPRDHTIQKSDRAIRSFRRVLEIEPRHLSAMYNLVMALMRSGRRDEGQQWMDRLKELKGDEQVGGPMGSIGAQYQDEGFFALAIRPWAAPAAGAAQQAVRFADVTTAAGIRFTHGGPALANQVLGRTIKAQEYSRAWAEKNLVPALGSDRAISIYNASSSPYTLKVMLIIALIVMPFALLYTVGVYYFFRGKTVVEPTGY